MATPASSSILFARGVIARISIWPILRIAIQESWGGPSSLQKRTWMVSEIVDAFETQSPVPDDQYIEEMLLQIMQDEFDTDVEDGSAESVAVDVVRIWEEASIGKQDLVLKFEDLAEQLKGTMVKGQIVKDETEELSDDEESDAMDSDDEGEEAPQLVRPPETVLGKVSNELEVDEEGFTIVKRGKGRR